MKTFCSGAGDYIDVSYYGTQSGTMNLVFDTEETGILSSGNERKVLLSEPSKDINPWTAIISGEFYVTTDSEDNMAAYGNVANTNVKLPDRNITLQTFSHLGGNKVSVGADFDGSVWCLRGEDAPMLAVEDAYRTVAELEASLPSDHVFKEKTKSVDEAPVTLFRNIPKSSPEFNSRKGSFRSSKFCFDRLRIFCVILPGSFKWYGVGSSQSLNFVFPDLMASQDADNIYMILEKASLSGNKNYLYGIKVCLAGYDDESTIIDLYKMKR